MNNQVKVGRNNLYRYIPFTIIGIGLIIIGLAAIQLISHGRKTSDYSVTPARVNFPAPELSLSDLKGEKISVADYRQNILLVNIWAIWCPPCKIEMPILEKYFEEHSDQGFTLLGIEAGDPQEQVKSFVSEYALSFPILLDPNKQAMIAFSNDNLPSSYVIDRNGTVVLAWTGPISHAMLEKYVTPLLEQ